MRKFSISSVPLILTILLFFTIQNLSAQNQLKVKLQKRTINTNQVSLSASSLSNLQLAKKHILIQFTEPVTDDKKEFLANSGIHLLRYVPDFAYTAFLDNELTQDDISTFDIHWFGQMTATDKISTMIDEIGIRDWARRGGDLVQFAVIVHPDEDLDARADELVATFGAEIIGIERSVGIIDLILPEDAMYRMSELDFVELIEPAMPPQEINNNSARTNTGADILQDPPYNLDGSGVVVAEWDGGHVLNTHNDLAGRVSYGDGASVANHATHVAGTVIGDGSNSGGTYRGMAPGASIVSFLWWGSSSELSAEYSSAVSGFGAKLATNSWGLGVGTPSESTCSSLLGNYYSACATLDNTVRGVLDEPILIFWSAGNQRGTSSQYCGSIGWTYGTIGVYGTAKNLVTIGAINSNNNTMTSFSSWGPVDDGRIKPDLVGPGCQSGGDGGITSTSSSGGYTVMCGTSMSTPAIAGTAALMYEQWKNVFLVGSVLPSTMKAILINTAEDLGDVGPDYRYGHGKVDGVAAVNKVSMGEPSYFENSTSTGIVQQFDLTVPSGTTKLKATLVWDDAGGTASASQTLINDLDLVLIDPFSAELSPWILDANSPTLPATTGTDRTNNVETVEIDNPTPGLWKARVTGFNVPSGPQKYSLVFSPDSIYTPGNLAALAVYDQNDQDIDPGQTTNAEFWISNIGANRDSIHIVIGDDNSWLTETIDTVFGLEPYDSIFFSVNALVPSSSLSGDKDSVVCTATSLINSGIIINAYVVITTNPFYAIVIGDVADDTASSPDSFEYTVLLENNGNAVDLMTLISSNDSSWNMIPGFLNVSVPPYSDTTITITVEVPAEILHLSTSMVESILYSTGGDIDTSNFLLLIENQYPPPGLVLPEDNHFTQQRSISFEWDASAADSSSIFIATDAGLTSLVQTYGSVAGNTFDMPIADSLGDNLYYWGVRQFFGLNESSLQASPFAFVIDNSAPDVLNPSSPANNSYVSFVTINFIFGSARSEQVANEAPEYSIIQLSQDPTFVSSSILSPPISGFSYLHTDTLDQGRWYWRVQHFDSAGNQSAYGTQSEFLFDNVTPSKPVQVSPEDDAIISDTVVNFVWTSGDTVVPYEITPEHYQLQIYTTSFVVIVDTLVYDDSIIFQTSMFEEEVEYIWRLRTIDSALNLSSYISSPNSFIIQPFMCGDIDGNQDNVTIADITYLVNYLFKGGPAPDPLVSGSVNCDVDIDISDLTYLVNYVFKGGPPPCCP